MAFSMVFSGDKYVDTEVAAIQADIGDASGSALGSLYAILGNPSTSLATQVAAIQTDLGDPSGRTNNKTILAILGAPDASGKTIYDNLGDFVARTNNKSLLAVLGVPDVAGKDLYTCLITDRLDSGTYGLSALNTDIDAIQTDLGDFSGRTNNKSLLAVLGVPDVAGKDLYTCLITDRLDHGTYGLSALDTDLGVIAADVAATDGSGSYSYLDAGGEQTVLELTPGANKYKINGIFLDLVNMTQNGTIKVYLKVDGTTYRELFSDSFVVATDSDGVFIDFSATINDDLKVTYTEGADEAAARTIPYQIVYEVK